MRSDQMPRPWPPKLELAPCPFCNASDEMIMVLQEGSYICVGCIECNAKGPDKNTVDAAIEAWNRRTAGDGGRVGN